MRKNAKTEANMIVYLVEMAKLSGIVLPDGWPHVRYVGRNDHIYNIDHWTEQQTELIEEQ